MSNAQITIVANANVQGAVQGFQQLNNAAQQSAQTMGKSKEGINSAAFALTNLGRVAQDAPFGFIAIQNNLNPLLESFQRLSAISKETGSSLGKNLIGAFTGPAGLGVALSLITSGITLYLQHLQSANKASANLAKTSEDYAASLDAISRAQLKGGQDAQKEIATLKVLYDVTQDTTQSLKARSKAVEQLQQDYPDYLGNFSKEQILAGEAKTAYDQLAASILATAKARAAEKIIAENASKQLENERKIVDLQKQQVQNRQKLAEANARERNATAGGGTLGAIGTSDIGQALQLNKQITTTEAQINKLRNDNVKLQEDSIMLESTALSLVKQGANLTDIDTKKKKTATELLKEQRAELERQLKLLEEIDKAGKLPTFRQPEIANLQLRILNIDAKLDKLPAENVEIKKDIIEDALNKKLAATPFNIKLGNIVVDTGTGFEQQSARGALNKLADGINTELALVNKELKPLQVIVKPTIEEKDLANLLKQADEMIKSLAIGGITSIAEVLGDAIVGDRKGMSEAINSFAQQFGNFFTEIGKMAVGYAIKMKVLEEAIKTLQPELALIAGVGLIALGAAVKGSLKQTTPFADGGIVTGPTNALIGEAGPEVIMPLNDINRFIGGLGNRAPQFVIADSRISGNDIVLSYQRTNKRINRTQ